MNSEMEVLWRKAVEKQDNNYLESLIIEKYEQIEKIQEFINNGRRWSN